MTTILGLVLDAALIVVVSAGVVQAGRLIAQLRGLRSSRAEIEKFVKDFNVAVLRAEAGIKNLRLTARESGDDLEKLIEKARMARDELTILIESADSVAERLTASASQAVHAEASSSAEMPRKDDPFVEKRAIRKSVATPVSSASKDKASLSRAEQELIQALKKLG